VFPLVQGEAMNRALSLMTAGVLTAAFMISGCGKNIELPKRGSAEHKDLYERCLKKLPEKEAGHLKELHTRTNFSEMSKYDKLLRACKAMEATP
jgi:hypothetical protein